ncbi:hypothetical protein JQ604_35315 [Bradyrhizobium jicamae]|uniref:hypothetical protein n=1 Tax=Bradyrhizobium jicamae TaxID=280332 RepID=UPI001BAC3C72|nr:hypothetical protein [Bradyrhizobium jicamae]MBR0757480.1 hypothetical protein [Bradyrhizobium jicamae]
MTEAIIDMDDAALDSFSGGWKNDYHYCSLGSTEGGGEGLYPYGVGCRTGTNAEVYAAFFNGFHSTCGCPP